ncbi:MAG: hypothetical protein RMZ43_028040 [Nostoc sp. CmiVER01]|uniref:hypothetical protein n=1 Tax=Nostoc sp. CmiVER01 TaxID=3075384 RepID=UPI002AD4C635|nr:hypothetical protein [Nostoc sp. CmiVER01]MDZ8123972.1 hypothetical protein [Nostoc sp. CmiVER01]
MENLNLENLDNELISFDLSPEDMEAIKGGTSVPLDTSSSSKCPSPPKHPFGILIVAVPPKHPFGILIVAVPSKSKDD